MKVVQIREYGGREVLQFTEQAPKPTPAHGQVLVQVQAASLNPIDWKLRAGSLKEHVPLTMPATLGVDCCGIVSQVGESESGLTIGDRVYGYASVFAGGSGSFAEYATANASALALAPQRVSVVEAAAAPLVGISALQALEEHIKLQRGQKILIHGGAGASGASPYKLRSGSEPMSRRPPVEMTGAMSKNWAPTKSLTTRRRRSRNGRLTSMPSLIPSADRPPKNRSGYSRKAALLSRCSGYRMPHCPNSMGSR